MTSVLLPLLIAFYIGYQVDENKMKQYKVCIDEIFILPLSIL